MTNFRIPWLCGSGVRSFHAVFPGLPSEAAPDHEEPDEAKGQHQELDHEKQEGRSFRSIAVLCSERVRHPDPRPRKAGFPPASVSKNPQRNVADSRCGTQPRDARRPAERLLALLPRYPRYRNTRAPKCRPATPPHRPAMIQEPERTLPLLSGGSSRTRKKFVFPLKRHGSGGAGG